MVSENSEIRENNDKSVKKMPELSTNSPPPPMEALATVRNYFKNNNIQVPEVIEKYFCETVNVENSYSNNNGSSSQTAKIKIEQPEKPAARFDGRWHCDLCNQIFGNTFEIQIHMKEIHEEQLDEGNGFLKKSSQISFFLFQITFYC